MKITATQRFRDGRSTYEKDAEYEVADLDGARFVGNGWATSPDYALPGTRPSPESVTVNIQPDSATHQTTATEA